ncbi:metallophosphoesterase family protein [Aquisphaera insulae]|uniref:metallophosphoesterase family protein n=1 Tax=Aquisphaera insulae TaxID=2712864 RepID=UPI0013EE2F54|nr:metallophosphoesterase [Aquisphaera insulae]
MGSTRRAQFETMLRVIADTTAEAAGPDEADDFEVGDDDQALIRDAMSYLESHPEIAGGDPDGLFTYEHPILAAAARALEEARSLGVEAAGDGSDLSDLAIVDWIRVGIARFRSMRNDPALVLLQEAVPHDHYELQGPTLRLALVGDAGHRGTAQTRVLDRIGDRHAADPFDMIVHLGDTYFGGTPEEFLLSFLEPFRSRFTCPIVTLCGNHDLYYGCRGYLSALRVLGQKGRYFAIESPDWRIACLDTAFGALDFRMNDGVLDPAQLEWLRSLGDGKPAKPLILMSHHYIRSHWHSPIESLREQLGDWARDNVFAWYWGHEHHLAAYSKGQYGFWGACVGNGAFLEKWSPAQTGPTPSDEPTWHAPEGCNCYGNKGRHAWPHGFLELELTPARIRESYHFERNEPYRRTIP